MSTLTGAARNTRDRAVLMDTARARTLDRDPAAPGDVEALLRSVYALTPAKARRKLDADGVMGEWKPKEGPAAWLAEQRSELSALGRDLYGAWVEKPGWALPLLREAMARPVNLDVFTGAFLCPVDDDAVDFSPYYVDDEAPWVHGAPDLRGVEAVATRYTGHGIGHQYRPDVTR